MQESEFSESEFGEQIFGNETQFIVLTSRTGNAVYFKGDENQSVNLAPISTSQEVISELFGQQFTYWTCKESKIVFYNYNTLIFIAIGQEGESIAFLKRQLLLVKGLFFLKFGLLFMKKLIYDGQFSARNKKAMITQLIDTMIRLSRDNQSFLVQANSRTHKRYIVKQVENQLQHVVQQNDEVEIALLFQDTQLIGYIKSNNVETVNQKDIFLMIIYIQSLFNSTNKLFSETSSQSEKSTKNSSENLNKSSKEVNEEDNENEENNLENEKISKMENEIKIKQPVKDFLDIIFLRTKLKSKAREEYLVYTSELQESTILVLINKKKTITREDVKKEKEKYRKVSNDFYQRIYQNAEMLGAIPFSITSFDQLFPGLVHFILVDRTNNLVFCPTIPIEQTTGPLIKKKVWDLCSVSQSYLMKGCSSMTIKLGEWCYSYTLWFEDQNKNLLSIPKVLPVNEIEDSQDFYEDLTSKLDLGKNVKCWELYTLYTGLLPYETVQHHNLGLYKNIFDRLIGQF
ncbi:hermansky-pudlak syndrome protein [Anaeramoeba flamelloides]|uniref:Hermansky-pudlak syndrome protein n=1 Tax=Anaeramoeba flamelloides TaxID=1746091 RepID=A0AAV7Z2S5_9EUKA|nr:hermansky-pudlak syndrome protein [Anaeramoeba flamelloides]KAJ6254939.1 hermansky-pudlak syndrome protein [Anaeramoeba flamelloides]